MDKKILFDNFIYDVRKKKFIQTDANIYTDGFISAIKKEFRLKRIHLEENPTENITRIFANETLILEIKDGHIISLYMPKTKRIKNKFLFLNTELKKAVFQSAKYFDNHFLGSNEKLSDFHAPNGEFFGDWFMPKNTELETISLPKAVQFGNFFLSANEKLTKVIVPEVQKIGFGFLVRNKNLKSINLDKLIKLGGYFMPANEELSKIKLLNCEEIHNGFMINNKKLKKIHLNSLIYLGNNFLPSNNKNLSVFYAPKLSIKYIEKQINPRVKELYLQEIYKETKKLTNPNIQKTK